MINKKKLLTLTGIFGTTALAFGVILATQAPMLKIAQGTDGQWNHYEGVAPTLDDKGIKEYWVNCNTHEHQFSAPAGVTPVEMGAPSEAFINSLASNDDRLVQRAWKALSFANSSDANVVTSVRNNFDVKEIVDDSTAPDKDGKVLKVTYQDSTADFMLNESYLDQVFSDSNVVALEFNAKCDTTTFTSKDISYKQQNTTIRYEGNGAAYFGLNQTWKTFAYPRSAYEAFKNDPNKSTISRNTFLWVGLSNSYITFELFLDNFHPVTRTLDWTGFEQGRHNPDAAYLSWRNSAGQEVFHAMSNNSSTTLNWQFDDSIKSEGGRSIKISRAASENVFFGINRSNLAWDTLLPTSSSIFSFDFRSSSNLNCNSSVSSILICKNIILSSGTNFQIPKDTWVRIVIPKSVIDRNTIFNFTGGTVCDFWVDNFQFNTDIGCFEDDTLIISDNKSWSYNGEYVNKDKHSNLDYAKVRTLKVQAGAAGDIGHVGLSSSRKTEGNKSLWIEQLKGDRETALYLSYEAKNFLTDNAGATISLDIYRRTADGAVTFRDGNRTNDSLAAPVNNSWNHYVLTASNLTADGRAILFQGSNTIGDWYVDNVSWNLA